MFTMSVWDHNQSLLRTNAQALIKSTELRQTLCITGPLPNGWNYVNLQKAAEVTRLCGYAVKCFTWKADPEIKYSSSDARADLIREMKKTRSVVSKTEEKIWIPAPVLKSIMEAIWSAAVKAK